MKKISLTGHSRGIGKGIVDLLSNDYEILGFSRSNGYDISVENDRNRILEESSYCDVFINNTYFIDSQALLFDMFYHKWYHDSTKTIININSVALYLNKTVVDNPMYSEYKKELHNLTVQRFLDRKPRCKIISVNPGFVDTDMLEPLRETKGITQDEMLSPVEFAESIQWLLNLPPNIEVCDLTVHKKQV